MKITIEVDSYAELLSFAATLLPAPATTEGGLPPNRGVPKGANGEDPATTAKEESAVSAGLATGGRKARKKADDLAKQAEQAAQASQAAATAGTAQAPSNVPSLETLKQAITVAARAAMKNEGPKAILDLLPAFRDATGLDFVMNAQEEHRPALFDLAMQAGVEIV